MSWDFKKPKIYRGGNKWYIEYYFRSPVNGKFQRFRVYEDINRYKGEDREAYAQVLCDRVLFQLNNGYSPFAVPETAEAVISEIIQVNEAKIPKLTAALMEFMDKKRENNIGKETIKTYTTYINNIERYLIDTESADIKADELTDEFLYELLSGMSAANNWGATTYNNHLAFIRTLINWFALKPRFWVDLKNYSFGEGDLQPKIARVLKHQYFSDQVAARVKEKLKEFPVLEFYSRFIYYSCMRPEEIRQLKIENVDTVGRTIKLVGKTGSRTVPICDELALMLDGLKLSEYPLNYYVIGKMGNVSEYPHSENWFSKMFREEIKRVLKLSDNFTLYGWKHTRVVDLLNAGYHDAEIMNLTGHRETASYDKYKRELMQHITTRLKGKTLGF